MDILNPFGLRNGSLIHISEVKQRGLDCNCTCPSCGDILIARLGEVRSWCFAHSNNCDCNFSLESALHLFAKEVLTKYNYIKIPEVIASFKTKVCTISKPIYFYFDHVLLEETVEDIIPDIILIKGDIQLFVEIKVTHGIDLEKHKKIERLDISTIEIDLSRFFFNKEFDRSRIETIIIENVTDYKRWIYNRKVLEKEIELEDEYLIEEKENMRNQKLREELKAKWIEEQKEKTRQLISELREKNPRMYGREEKLLHTHLWKKANEYLNLTVNEIPTYLNYKIQGEIVFNCDRRIWQTYIFSNFINKYIKRQKSDYILVKGVVSWLKKDFVTIPINTYLTYLDKKEFEGIPDLTDVIGEFLLNLCRYGVLRLITDYPTENNKYHWCFIKLVDNIKLLPRKYQSNEYTEIGNELVNVNTGEVVGKLSEVYKKIRGD
ncbi:competence CoiA-like predicted nuclease [Natranaerovirga pectinivora]|uniref:Competence CoiA-like predicted nuclease n=1 Tax=Natranaerovirga pectinivora TaxID=682400 RepID=A0A4R3MMZ9_9FIRM|nr:competence protein CoiA family protein [Natranaerovirga pectinivora]TCT14552.1 competence CoiA-like predicted nuclease [Natranaerovirga pectinivora]